MLWVSLMRCSLLNIKAIKGGRKPGLAPALVEWVNKEGPTRSIDRSIESLKSDTLIQTSTNVTGRNINNTQPGGNATVSQSFLKANISELHQ